MRILYLVHGHNQFSVGGGENAAFSLFEETKLLPDIETWIISAVHTSMKLLRHGEIRYIDGTDSQYLLGTACEWFRFKNNDINGVLQGIKPLLDYIQPDIIHLQHFVHFGIDIIPVLQKACPNAKLVLTLHEYLALCMNNGQMVTTGENKLCEKATSGACSVCFPQHTTGNIFLRHYHIKTIIQSCDALISPSQFLMQRYRDCGITHEMFFQVENGLPTHFSELSESLDIQKQSVNLNQFAFFGQLNPYKGLIILFNAAKIMRSSGAANFAINIYGANLDKQSKGFQDEFSRLSDEVGDIVTLHGSYSQRDLKNLMLANDWVIVPSTWWENSPVVIQESFFYGRPVIGSNIGGIKEKISGRGGITFEARNAHSLARCMTNAIGNQQLHQKLQGEMATPTMASSCADAHIEIYKKLLCMKQPGMAPEKDEVR